eukprot:snap_masked-scaffold_55-processed-gene-1.26-mRNA-1 protein AED:0.02 eAED:0.02 QI:0/-1/0/1/-1/1/1/0/244
MVAGHSVLDFSSSLSSLEDDTSWHLLDYQKNIKFGKTISDQIQKGLSLLSNTQDSILIFSGGVTRKEAGVISEAMSYVAAAEILLRKQNLRSHFRKFDDLSQRILTEDFATDSFENLMFSIARFAEFTGNYPEKISVVSLDFKKNRFVNLHRKALNFHSSRFKFYGVDILDKEAKVRFTYFERTASIEPFKKDPFGCHEQKLKDKRKERNPFHRKASYEITCPELRQLLNYCGTTPFKATLPWN